MQKRLRLRFLLIIWALLMLFLAALTAGVCFYMYQSAVSETETALRMAIETQELEGKTRGMAALWLDDHGGLLKAEQSHLNLDETSLDKLAGCLEIPNEKGIGVVELDGARYRYLAVLRGGGAYVAVAECSQERSLLDTMRQYTPWLALIGVVLLIPVSLLLSRWVAHPIELAWEKQNDFVSDATHELKTPLAVIAANTEAVLNNPEASIGSQDKWLQSIRGETSRMAGLVGDLLFLAKIDAGEIHLELEEVGLSDLLEEMCMEREYEIFEKGVTFDYAMTPDIMYTCDRKRLTQMVEAVLDNAVKYTPAGGTIRVIVNHGKRLQIIISNSGNPIPEKELPKLFDRFYRSDPSRTRDTGGHGLGLCVAQSIAKLHGGVITAACENKINVFTIHLGDASAQLVEN